MSTSTKVLLLGGFGMLGTSIKKYLVKNKINFISPPKNNLNLLNKREINNFIAKKKFTHVINAAGLVGGILSNIKRNTEFFEKNLEMNYNLINVAYRHEIPNFFNIGSSCMYPKIYLKPMSENYLFSGPLEETNFGYALAKLNAAYYLKMKRDQESDLNYCTFIPPNLYGPYDNFDPKSSHLIASIVRKVIDAKKNNEKELIIWGTGKVKREFLHVDDVGCYIAKLTKKNFNFPPFLNIGSFRDLSVKQYYKKTMEAINLKAKLIYDLTKPEGMRRKLMNSNLAKQKYSWQPKISLEKGLIEVIKFYQKNYV